jgi:hypothetical protein
MPSVAEATAAVEPAARRTSRRLMAEWVWGRGSLIETLPEGKDLYRGERIPPR